jgi:hypothetical protein
MATRKAHRSPLANRIPDEERKAERGVHADFLAETTEAETLGALRLSAVEFRHPRELKPSPHNTEFAHLKDDTYWANLRRDIEESGAITDPVLIMPDGEILSGHSRIEVAVQLLEEGHAEFEKVPVRVVRSALNDDERMKRVYLSNLSRFEIDENTRLVLYARVYPDYFNGTGPKNRPQKGDTVSPLRSNVADAMGVSPRQLRRERKVHEEAVKKAKSDGRQEPSVEDVGVVRKMINGRRKSPKEQIKERFEPVATPTTPYRPVSTDAIPTLWTHEARQLFERALSSAIEAGTSNNEDPAFFRGVLAVLEPLRPSLGAFPEIERAIEEQKETVR